MSKSQGKREIMKAKQARVAFSRYLALQEAAGLDKVMMFCLFAFVNKELLMVFVGRREGDSQERVDNFRKKESILWKQILEKAEEDVLKSIAEQVT